MMFVGQKIIKLQVHNNSFITIKLALYGVSLAMISMVPFYGKQFVLGDKESTMPLTLIFLATTGL
jgi:hypothetical protein